MPPVGWAPDHDTAISWRPFRSAVWLTSRVTVRVSTTLSTPPTTSSRDIVSVLVNAGAVTARATSAVPVTAASDPVTAAPDPDPATARAGRATERTTQAAAARAMPSFVTVCPGSAVAPGGTR